MLDTSITSTYPSVHVALRVSRSGGHWKAVVPFFLLALAVRLPYLQQIPAFIESNELRITLDLVSGKQFPLNDFRPYLGALFNYITACCFWLFGMHYWIPRAIVAAGGAATVPLVYLLGCRLAGKKPAVLASTMMTVSVYPVFFLSHVAWPNSLTPLLTTALLLCFFLALQRRKVWPLIAAAFLFGLALQTHPSAITLAPALLLLFLLKGREHLRFWLRKPATYCVIPAAAAGYANMVFYDIQQRAAAVDKGLHGARYAIASDPTVHSYLDNLKSACILLLRLAAGSAEDKLSVVAYFYEPLFLICLFSVCAGVVLCLRARRFELPVLLLCPLLIIPAINSAYDFYSFGRYLGFLIPLAYLLMATAIIHGLNVLAQRAVQPSPAVRAGVLALFVIGHLTNLIAFYAELELTGDTTEIYQQSREALNQFDKKTTGVVIDPHAFKATPMFVYLEMDGFHVEDMTGASPGHGRRLGMDRFLERWMAQKEKLASQFSATVGVLSPELVRRFLHQTPFFADGCVVLYPGTPDSGILTCYHAGSAVYLEKRGLSQPQPDDDQ